MPEQGRREEEVTGRIVSARVHGGPDAHELAAMGLSDVALLAFSVNVNPYGAAPAMLAAIRGARLDRYPDDHAVHARAALGGAWGVSPDRIAVGNGAAELLWTLVQLICRDKGPLLVVEPTFVEPALAAQACNVAVHRHVTRADSGFAIDVAALVDQARRCGARAIYLTSPQNPTGRLVPPVITAEVAAALPEVSVLLDEAFLRVSCGFADVQVPLPDNVVRVRSLTKEHALPGLRVGALLGPPALVASIARLRPAWTVSAPALAAAEEAAALGTFVTTLRSRWLADADNLRARLLELAGDADLERPGLEVLPSDTVFLLVRLKSPSATLRAALLGQHGILVRDCASFGLPDCVRLCARPAADVDRLIAALRATLTPPI